MNASSGSIPCAIARIAAACLALALAGCADLGGPGVAHTAPRVAGRVVDAGTGEPIGRARVGRELYVLRQPTGGFRKGAEELRLLSRYTRTDADGRFELPPEKVVFPIRFGTIRPDLRLSVQRTGWLPWTTNWPSSEVVRSPGRLEVDAGEIGLEPR